MSSLRRTSSRTESIFYDSEFDQDEEFNDEREEGQETSIDQDNNNQSQNKLNRRSSNYSTWSSNSSNNNSPNTSSSSSTSIYLSAASRALGTLDSLKQTPNSNWKKVLTHSKSGTIVYMTKQKLYVGPKESVATSGSSISGNSTKNSSEGYYAPVFKSELIVKGFNAAEVFKVIGNRSCWDDWYKDGYLLENLSDTASLTYM